jgi:hypothetical protein
LAPDMGIIPERMVRIITAMPAGQRGQNVGSAGLQMQRPTALPRGRRAIAFGETVAFLSSYGNREVGEPNCDCPGLQGEREKKAKQPATLPRCVHAIAPARPH